MRNKAGIRLFAIIITVAMLVAMVPMMVFAEDQGGSGGTALHQLQNPVVENGVTTWDCVYFGKYKQSSDDEGGFLEEPIKWRVLSVNGDDAFLLADQNLDEQRYHTSRPDLTWEKCTLRIWLNGYNASENKAGVDYSYSGDSFLDTAFSDVEQQAINETLVRNENNSKYGTAGGNDTTDKIYLLSLGEAGSADYGFISDKTRKAQNTAYASDRGVYTNNGNGSWWLRSPGCYADRAAYVFSNGYVDVSGDGVSDYNHAVRPALHLNLQSPCWRYAGTITSEGVVTPSEQDVASASVSLPAPFFEYTGSEIKPEPTVRNADTVLTKDVDYTVVYANNVELGTGTATITAIGDYIGTLKVNFEIVKADVSKAEITLKKSSFTFDDDYIRPAPIVKMSGRTLVEYEDYYVKYADNKNVGEATLTIIGTGNYTGTGTATFTINPVKTPDPTPAEGEGKKPSESASSAEITVNGTAIKKLSKVKKGFTVKWAKSSAENASGYQVRYSTKSSMAGAKTKTIKGYGSSSKKITKLKAKKKYYVQVRVYRTVGEQKYYSTWSAKKSVKTK